MKSTRFFSHVRLLGLLVVLGLLAAACGGSALGIGTEGRDINPAVGRNVVTWDPEDRTRTPSFAGDYVTGGSLASGEHLGKITVVNFWASWCPPCIEEQPVLERTWKKYRERGVLFIGIDVRDTVPNAKAFLEGFDFEVTYPSIFDPDQRMAHEFRVSYPPSTFVLDRKGRIAARLVGAATEAGELDVLIDKVLAE